LHNQSLKDTVCLFKFTEMALKFTPKILTASLRRRRGYYEGTNNCQKHPKIRTGRQTL
jgi:hypothetical protein